MSYTIVFWGTTEYSALMLSALLEIKEMAVPLVVTKRGKPAGRGLDIHQSPVACFARKRLIPVIEVEKTQEASEQLRRMKADLFFVVDFGKIIPRDILDIPKHGAMNFHPSLLPKHRGPSPIVTTILNGDTETGFSYMLLDAEVDHGPLLYQERVALEQGDTAGSLEHRLFKRGGEKLEYVVRGYLTGNLKPTEQNHSKATYTKLIQKSDACLDFSREDAETAERKVRAYNPWPLAYFFHNGKRIQILSAEVTQCANTPARQFIKTREGVVVSCAHTTFLLLRIIRPEGKQARSSKEFEQYF